MRRIHLFLAILVSSLVFLTILIAVGIYIFAAAQQSPYSWMGGMWSGMMGGRSQAVQNPALPFFGVTFVVLIGAVAVGVAGMAYYLVLPEIKTGVAPVVCESTPQVRVEQDRKASCTPLDSVMKTLSDDERKVIDVLAAHDGRYLQKYIRSEAGLNRLQTHRVVARLAARGIVTLEKTGNTNQVLLADWLKQ